MAAALFSIFDTLALWDINPRAWLTEYLSACAEAGGQVPEEPERFLPWNMDERLSQALSFPTSVAQAV